MSNNNFQFTVKQGKSGYVAIVGRPNVGKSTLLNRILGQKISITSRKPQTTRHQILGVKTVADSQVIYVDTPGLHKDKKHALNRYMNRAASSALRDVDLVVFVIERTAWTDEDELVLEKIKQIQCPVILALNKVDQVADKDKLLPWIQQLSSKMSFAEILPIAALNGDNVEALEKEIAKRLSEGTHYFPEDQVTDRSERFMAAELVREKIMRRLGDEIPYQVAVEIEEFKRDKKLVTIRALILVEREGQKKIIIGKKGEQIKAIGRDARLDMEKLFDSKVMLTLWIKVKSGWSDSDRALRSLGYDDM
ncbi:MAG: GTPase Era [Pseudomonadales bacterium]|nr:GTPase Era [Pseudomonadales bacterium]